MALSMRSTRLSNRWESKNPFSFILSVDSKDKTFSNVCFFEFPEKEKHNFNRIWRIKNSLRSETSRNSRIHSGHGIYFDIWFSLKCFIFIMTTQTATCVNSVCEHKLLLIILREHFQFQLIQFYPIPFQCRPLSLNRRTPLCQRNTFL